MKAYGGKILGPHWIGGWMDPKAGLDDVEKRNFLALPGLELRTLGRPTRSQSLYQVRYPGSSAATDTHEKMQEMLETVFTILSV
jgi:hypothetical protein